MTRNTYNAEGAPKSDGRTITFLANSGKQMIQGHTVDLPSLKVPVSDGTLKLVTDLTEDDVLTVPLLVDHMFNIEHQAGHVTRLWMTEEGLMAAARLADVKIGDTVKHLAEEGSLTNSFSITIDCQGPDKNGLIKNAELVEISVVYRGADPRAAFRSLNNRDNRNGEQMTLETNNLTQDEAQTLTDVIQTALNEGMKQIAEQISALTGKNDEKTDPTPEEPNQSSNARAMPVTLNKAGQAGGVATITANRQSWLDSPEAFTAFEKILTDPRNDSPELVNEAWNSFARGKMSDTASYAVTGVDKLVPTEVVTTIEDALNTRGSGIWNMLRKTGMDQLNIGGANVAGTLTDANRAHGYPVASYGTAKKEQAVAIANRLISAEYTYKYITLNKGDIRRTRRPGVLLRYILEELPNYIVQTIEKQLVLGSFDADMKHFRSIITDMKDAASAWAGNKFALKVEHGTQSVLLYDFVTAAHRVTAPGEKIAVMSPDTLTDLLLSQDAEGRTLIDLGDEGVARRIGVSKIITPEWWADADDTTALGVVFTPANYAVVGDTSIEAFTNFALQKNTQEYLQEIWAGGGLAKMKSAAVITPSAK